MAEAKLMVQVEPDFEHFRQRVKEEIAKAERDLGEALKLTPRSGAEMIGRPLLVVAETGERFSGVITAAEETENGWQYTLQQRPFEAPELHA
ncbi:hypothetical protein CLM85_27915 [Streptomyces albidoflavus]|uniref:hypothetical protein n=1 Tax=Streptomyces albidoflavus TaxID=1886 RepID=UPI000BAE32FE|nr:hypothetical protein [Streptomyces albidoflavus]PAX85491.1 hypothetical protein CLM82_31375 [Streptomyces albidoflavus]PBO17703.1 hypothetical protein CLM83_16380 [Streptomyces albidoflavus]PBO21454.1 hypothetical protein CLM85_27915 [Streptomyces albidoflavus]PBO29747.1 hypothetical protein CLM84_12240 [Streptomyces albidoflavus]